MALIKCAECGKQISDKANTCPNCGCPLKKEKRKETIKKVVNKNSKMVRIWTIIIIVGVILGIGIAMIIDSSIKNNFDETYYHNGTEKKYYIHFEKNNHCEFKDYKYDDEYNCEYKITQKNESGYPKEIIMTIFSDDRKSVADYKCTRTVHAGGTSIYCEYGDITISAMKQEK